MLINALFGCSADVIESAKSIIDSILFVFLVHAIDSATYICLIKWLNMNLYNRSAFIGNSPNLPSVSLFDFEKNHFPMASIELNCEEKFHSAINRFCFLPNSILYSYFQYSKLKLSIFFLSCYRMRKYFQMK